MCCAFGALVFIASFWLGGEDDNSQILITEADVRRIQQQWQLEQGQLPSSFELESLLDAFVLEEMQYREALALGLDFNDTIIRRRLVQKYQFIVEDQDSVKADEQQLRDFFADRGKIYEIGERVSFRHIFFSSTNKSATSNYIRSLIPTIEEDNWYALGDPFPLAREYSKVSQTQIVNTLGNRFLTALSELSGSDWEGPIESLYGKHLVKVKERVPPTMPSFEEVRAKVELDYQAFHRDEAYRANLDELRSKYQVVMDFDLPNQ